MTNQCKAEDLLAHEFERRLHNRTAGAWRQDKTRAELVAIGAEADAKIATLTARVAELSGALLDIDGRLRECMGNPHISAADAYDSSYQELVSEALGAAAIRQRKGAK
jgi:hypothetical protein